MACCLLVVAAGCLLFAVDAGGLLFVKRSIQYSEISDLYRSRNDSPRITWTVRGIQPISQNHYSFKGNEGTIRQLSTELIEVIQYTS